MGFMRFNLITGEISDMRQNPNAFLHVTKSKRLDILTNLMILISIQLFVDVVISLKKIGANDK